MKKAFAMALALLMLCGCGTQPPVDTAPSTAETTPQSPAPTEEVVINHEALEVHELPYDSVTAAFPMGEDILLLVGKPTTLVKLGGKQLKKTASATAQLLVDPQSPAIQVTDTGVSYPDTGAVVFLDAELKETDRITMPDQMTHAPAVSADLQTIYYTTAGTVRAIDRETGLDRPLRQTTYSDLMIRGLHADDTILECMVYDDQDNPTTLFISTATGELCQLYHNSISVSTSEKSWFASISEDGDDQHLVGADGQSILTMTPEYTYSALRHIPELDGALIISYAEGVTSLDYCSTETGKSQAVMSLDGSAKLLSIWGNAGENCIWLLADNSTLFRWDLERSAIDDGVSCLAPYYTRENPDTAGLAALESAAQELEAQYHVKIHIAEEAVAVQPAGYTLVSEYRVKLLSRGLEDLSAALARFDPDFLDDAGKTSDDGAIHISLVYSITGSADQGTLDSVSETQFWDTDGNARIILALGDTLEQRFCHALGHIIDARVMSECSAFDSWNRLNPKGFDYDYDYITNRGRDGSAYAAAFIDTYAMSFPTEDRARIFEYAMMEGNETIFQSETMAKKLHTLCSGIRKAFDLTDSEAELPWEQYLTE